MDPQRGLAPPEETRQVKQKQTKQTKTEGTTTKTHKTFFARQKRNKRKRKHNQITFEAAAWASEAADFCAPAGLLHLATPRRSTFYPTTYRPVRNIIAVCCGVATLMKVSPVTYLGVKTVYSFFYTEVEPLRGHCGRWRYVFFQLLLRDAHPSYRLYPFPSRRMTPRWHRDGTEMTT